MSTHKRPRCVRLKCLWGEKEITAAYLVIIDSHGFMICDKRVNGYKCYRCLLAKTSAQGACCYSRLHRRFKTPKRDAGRMSTSRWLYWLPERKQEVPEDCRIFSFDTIDTSQFMLFDLNVIPPTMGASGR